MIIFLNKKRPGRLHAVRALFPLHIFRAQGNYPAIGRGFIVKDCYSIKIGTMVHLQLQWIGGYGIFPSV